MVNATTGETADFRDLAPTDTSHKETFLENPEQRWLKQRAVFQNHLHTVMLIERNDLPTITFLTFTFGSNGLFVYSPRHTAAPPAFAGRGGDRHAELVGEPSGW